MFAPYVLHYIERTFECQQESEHIFENCLPFHPGTFIIDLTARILSIFTGTGQPLSFPESAVIPGEKPSAVPINSADERQDTFMAKGPISDKQQQILEYIKDQIMEKGYPPAVREICDAVHLKSTSSVHSHLETLERRGYIRRDPTKPRAIEICDDNFQMLRTETASLPVVGRVAAGEPILAEQNIESYFPIPAEYVPRGESFILKVHGTSMINVGIMDGDFIFVNSCSTAENGEIVVALIDDSATVKRFFKEKDHIRLQPENDEMEPIIVDDCRILGKVFGVYRVMK